MSGQGIFQIVVYTVVLVALAYPLGIYMAGVYAGGFATRGRLRFLGVPERLASTACSASTRSETRTGRATPRQS